MLTYALTRLPTHNALIPAMGTITIVAYFKHVPLGKLLRIQSIFESTTKLIIFRKTQNLKS